MELTVLHRSGRRVWRFTMSLATRAALPYVLLVALFAGLVGLLGFWGINLMDGGLILAYAHRILAGEIPHKDFITPRPAGSAILHLVEFGSPLPLLVTSKLVTLAEFVAYGVFFSLLVYGKRLAQLSALELCGTCIAVLIGINQFPIIDFYTIDGLVFVGLGFLVLRRSLEQDRIGLAAFGFASLGVATTLKQSFWFAPFLAFAWVLGTRVVERRGRIASWTAVALTTCAAAPALYVAYVTLGGGFSEMRTELTGQRPVWIGNLVLDQLRDANLLRQLLPALVATIALSSFVYARARLEARLPSFARFLRRADLPARALLTAVLLGVSLEERLRFNGSWAARLFWCTLALVVIRSVLTRRVDVPGVLVVFTAWMVSLSWGAPTPALAAGACAIYLADAIWREGQPFVESAAWKVFAVGALLATLLVAVIFVGVRTNKDYGTPRSTETALLGGVSNELSGVYTDPATAAYLQGVARCTRRYDAKWVAVVPEGALTYPVLDLRNPFPIDWFWPDDYRGAGDRERLLAAASRTDARGDYLVLFQTAPFGLSASGVARRKIASFSFDPALAQELASRLRHARPAPCGGFVAYYSPST